MICFAMPYPSPRLNDVPTHFVCHLPTAHPNKMKYEKPLDKGEPRSNFKLHNINSQHPHSLPKISVLQYLPELLLKSTCYLIVLC